MTLANELRDRALSLLLRPSAVRSLEKLAERDDREEAERRQEEIERLRAQAEHAALVEVQRADAIEVARLAGALMDGLRVALSAHHELRKVLQAMGARVPAQYRPDLPRLQGAIEAWAGEAGLLRTRAPFNGISPGEEAERQASVAVCGLERENAA
jgi:hypothetical protein